jgi:hypothetical protein
MRDGRIFPKTSAPLYLMTTYRMSLIKASSISLDSTFNKSYGCHPGEIHGWKIIVRKK